VSLAPTDALLTDRSAVVTGGGGGIGAAVCEALAAFGAAVVVLDRDGAGADRVATAIRGRGGRAEALEGDARAPGDVEAALARADERHGPVRILVNVVGGVFVEPFLDGVEKGWDAILRANLKTVLHATQRAGRRMREHRLGGSIVSIVSIEAARAAPGYAVYAAAKAGVVSFTKTMAVELGADGVRVNALAPDVCLTDALRALLPAGREAAFPRLIPLGRAGVPDDVAGAAVFLASDLARYVTGVTLPVDGGTAAAGGWYRGKDGRWILGPEEP
jgi:3-oxoacyl-[acyl-carrier protein] reductase